MDYVPHALKLSATKLESHVVNTFRIESVSSDTAGPGKIVTFNLPESALISLPSIALHADVATTESTVNTKTVYGRLPTDAGLGSLISRLEVYLNGISITQGCAEYNTVCRILGIARRNRDKAGSIDRALCRSDIVSADEVEDASLVFTGFRGLIGGESTCQMVDTALLGQLTVRITFAPASVLAYKQAGRDLGLDFDSADARTAAAAVTYSVSNMYMTVDSHTVSPMYHDMLRQRLASEGEIAILFKEYYTFALENIPGGTSTTKFSLSSQSIDKLYAVFRDSNHQTAGIKTHSLNSTLAPNTVSNALRFMSYDNNPNDASKPLTKANDLRYNWSVNNVQFPQHRAKLTDALFALAQAGNKLSQESTGNLVSSLESYHEGLCVLALNLNFPGESIACQSGFDSRSINANMSLTVSGMTMPAVSATAQTTASISSFVVAETTAQLLVAAGRSCAVRF